LCWWGRIADPAFDVDAHVAKVLRNAEEAQLLRDEMMAIQARVDTALTTYETVRCEPIIVDSDKAIPGGGPTNVRVTIQKTKQELVDTFNFRLAQQRAQTSTLQCMFNSFCCADAAMLTVFWRICVIYHFSGFTQPPSTQAV
jgi:hypothetical protein